MDAQMPEMNGLDATRYIREQMPESKKGIPIIALTASVINTDLQKCFDAGMNAYVPKPFRREDLLNTLVKFYRNENGVAPGKTTVKTTTVSEAPASENMTDLTFLSEFCEGDKSRMKRYIDIYLKVTPGNLDKIDKALEEKNYTGLAQTVHAMKAHLNYMGMKPTRAVAEEIELSATEQNNLEQLPNLIAKLRGDWEQSYKELILL